MSYLSVEYNFRQLALPVRMLHDEITAFPGLSSLYKINVGLIALHIDLCQFLLNCKPLGLVFSLRSYCITE